MNRDANEFEEQEQHQRVLDGPDLYTGPVAREERSDWTFNFETERMEYRTINISPAMVRLYLEILLNACDNACETQQKGMSAKQIEISMNNTTVQIKNYGIGIPVVMKESKNGDCYVPESIFGRLNTSSNYDKNKPRIGGGKNGLGAKLTNIFSTYFEIVIQDPVNKLEYTQVWKNNMYDYFPPTIVPYTGKTTSIQVTYDLDFKRFRMQEYTEEEEALFRRYAIDAAFNTGIPVIFNDVIYNHANMMEYAKYYYSDDILKTAIPYYLWPLGTTVKSKNGEQHGTIDGKPTYPTMKGLFIDSEEQENISSVSFLNCIPTYEGGIHVDGLLNVLVEEVKKIYTSQYGDKKPKPNAKLHFARADIQRRISILVAARFPSPNFKSQCKERFTGYEPNADTTITVLTRNMLPLNVKFDKLSSWNLLTYLYALKDLKAERSVKNARLTSRLTNKKGSEANFSNTKQRSQCVLCVAEGDSAAGYFEKQMEIYAERNENGRDWYGMLPLRGKAPNAIKQRNKSVIFGNEEYKNLMSLLGLCPGLDYTVEENYEKLRHGSLLLMTDADDDGKHISALIMCFLRSEFPTLLKRPFLYLYSTPILRAFKGTVSKSFYTTESYKKWLKENNDGAGWTIKYYKGLATPNKNDIKKDMQEDHKILCVCDSDAFRNIDLSFSDDRECIEKRKEWILDWITNKKVELEYTSTKCMISDFLLGNLMSYSAASVERAIPRLIDGFKHSHRQVIHGVWKTFGVSVNKTAYGEKVTSGIASKVKDICNYHHGNAALEGTIAKMAQTFVGSNNLPLLYSGSSIGTRKKLGKDAGAPRYTEVAPQVFLPFIIRPEDEILLEYVISEGQQCEPKEYYPIIPLCLINGVSGISTGWQTYIPNHNPQVIVDWIRTWLNGGHYPIVKPWYRGFSGKCEIMEARKAGMSPEMSDAEIAEHLNELSEIPDENDDTESNTNFDSPPRTYSVPADPTCMAMVTTGRYEVDGKIVRILEVPIAVSGDRYEKEFLHKLYEDKEIGDIRSLCAGDRIAFELLRPTEQFLQKVCDKYLKLRKSFRLSNMYLLDGNGIPHKYNCVEEILSEFCELRYAKYEQRKERTIPIMEEKLKFLKDKLRFFEAFHNKEINLHPEHFNEKEVHAYMDAHDIPRSILQSVKFKSALKENLIKLQNEIGKLEQELQDYIATTPEQMWSRELDEFEAQYLKWFNKIEKDSVKAISKKRRVTSMKK